MYNSNVIKKVLKVYYEYLYLYENKYINFK